MLMAGDLLSHLNIPATKVSYVIPCFVTHCAKNYVQVYISLLYIVCLVSASLLIFWEV